MGNTCPTSRMVAGVCTGAPMASVLLIETGPGESGAGAKEGTAPGAELGCPRLLRKDPGQGKPATARGQGHSRGLWRWVTVSVSAQQRRE